MHNAFDGGVQATALSSDVTSSAHIPLTLLAFREQLVCICDLCESSLITAPALLQLLP